MASYLLFYLVVRVFVALALGSGSTHMSSDSEEVVVGNKSVRTNAQPRQKRARTLLDLAEPGPSRIFMVHAATPNAKYVKAFAANKSSKLLEDSRRNCGLAADFDDVAPGGTATSPRTLFVLGFVVAPLWQFVDPLQAWDPEAERSKYALNLARVHRRVHRSCDRMGFLQYEFSRAAYFAEPFLLELDTRTLQGPAFDNLTRQSIIGRSIQTPMISEDNGFEYSELACDELLDNWRQDRKLCLNDWSIVGMDAWLPLGQVIVRGCWPIDLRPILEKQQQPIGVCKGAPPIGLLKRYRENLPSAYELDKHAASASENRVEDANMFVKCPTGFIDRFHSEHLINCVRGSRNLQAVSDLPETASDIASMLPKETGDLVNATLKNSENYTIPSRQAVEQSRVTFHVASMMAIRSDNCSDNASVCRSLNYDCSPQAGLETMATREEKVTDGDISASIKIKHPIQTCGHAHCGVIDKLMRLVHSIFLLAGPTMAGMYKYADSVTLCIADYGSEGNLVDERDAIPLYFKRMEDPNFIDVSILAGTFMFKYAIGSLPINHIMEWVLLQTLQVLPWYPAWAALTKLVCRFLKSRGYRQVLVAELKKRGLHVEAKDLSHFSASFANWRWSTLVKVLRELTRVSVALDAVWNPNLFRFKEAEMRGVHNAIASREYWTKVDMVDDLVRDWNALRGWMKACPCCGDASLDASIRHGTYVCPNNAKSMRATELKGKLHETYAQWIRKSVELLLNGMWARQAFL
jgi:hypothetical protein